jgi:hypothetical protein
VSPRSPDVNVSLTWNNVLLLSYFSVVKSFEVLAILSSNSVEGGGFNIPKSLINEDASPVVIITSWQNPMYEDGILDPSRRKLLSRDRSVFASLIDLHSKHQKLLMDISKVIELMCT